VIPCALFQAQLAAEVDALGKDWVASFSDLEEKLPYMDAVLKESLRLYPPAHTLVREAEKNITVEGSSCSYTCHVNS
jgi:cytochrome P450